MDSHKTVLQEEPALRFDFEVLHNTYFVFKEGTHIYYFNMLSYDSKSNKVKMVNLELRPGVITQLVQTQKPHLLQFVYVQYCPNKVTFIITWNLETNMEDQTLEIPMN